MPEPLADMSLVWTLLSGLQVWKMKGWPHQINDGIFVQLESLKPLRKCWFMSTDDKQAQEVSTDYKILEPIFR
jgi:hypothetical protein